MQNFEVTSFGKSGAGTGGVGSTALMAQLRTRASLSVLSCHPAEDVSGLGDMGSVSTESRRCQRKWRTHL